ncbi:MAG: NifU family protein [Bacteroidota bacterium]
MTIYTEITPNPATLKFVTDKILLTSGSADFPSADSTADSPLAQKLFELAFVKGVFIGYNFVSVTKADDKEWEAVIPLLKSTLKAYLESGEPILLNQETPEPVVESEDDPTIRRIKQLLEENIRPAVAMDGGDVIFESFDEGKVKLRLQGACSGCPSSTMTLKMGIEGLLTRMVPEVKEVEAVS